MRFGICKVNPRGEGSAESGRRRRVIGRRGAGARREAGSAADGVGHHIFLICCEVMVCQLC
jgi:hypothetical protein